MVAAALPDWPAAVADGDQLLFPVVFMRGGTSRGAFVHAGDLPSDPELRDRVVLALYGSPDPRQIDGIGGANPLTSKLAIVSRSTRDDADVDYLFAQVGVEAPVVDFGGNCGNMLAGVGPFAIDEGLVPATGPVARVRVYNVNTGSVIVAEVPVSDGRASTHGTTEIAGVPGSGAGILLDFAATVGTLGRGLLPTGSVREELAMSDGRSVDVTIADAANVTVFVRAEDIGLTGDELLAPVPPAEGVERLREVRRAAAAVLGLASGAATADFESLGIPKAYAVAPPMPYTTRSGRQVGANEISVIGRGLTAGAPHAAYASTVAVCTAVAAMIPGSVVAEQLKSEVSQPTTVRIGHPGGVLPVDVAVDNSGNEPTLERAAIARTARRLLRGLAAVPRDVLGLSALE